MTYRELMQQALEALEDMLGWESLAPQSVQASSKQSLQRLREALAHPDPEPVAWTNMSDANDWLFLSGRANPNGKLKGEWTALYTHPPQRKPLTDDEVRKLWDSHTIEVYGKIGINPVLFARYLEREYGIGEKE